MGVFRTKFVTENVGNCGETVEREGEAQNTTLHAKFSKRTIDRFSRASRKRFKLTKKYRTRGT